MRTSTNILILLIITTALFSAETLAQKTINMDTKTFDVEKFDKHKINKEYNFEIGDTIVRQVESSDSYAIYTTYKNNNYEDRIIYYKKSKNLKMQGRLFSVFGIGIFKYYDSSGILIEERNFDYLYDFTVDQLIEKIKKEYGVDINVNDPTHILVTREDSPYPVYRVQIPYTDYGFRTILINGKSGDSLVEIDREGKEKKINPMPTIPKEEKKKNWFGF